MLCIAAADPDPIVTSSAVTALATVVTYLEEGNAATRVLFPDVVLAAVLAAKNPHHEVENARALGLILRCIAVAATRKRSGQREQNTSTSGQ